MIRRLCVLLLFASATLLHSFTISNDEYWLSFSLTNAWIAKINSAGSLLVTPVKIGSANSRPFFGFVTAISSAGSNKINYWATAMADSDLQIRRGVIDKNSPQATTFQTFAVLPKNVLTLSVTQKDYGTNFLVFEKPKEVLKGFGITSNGTFNGNSFRVSPRTDGSFLIGGVSSDGRMAWSWASLLSTPRLYVQPLDANGIPVGTPNVVGTPSFTLSTDISNPLSGGKRMVVYFANDGSSKIMTQLIDAATGKPLASPRVIGTANTDYSDLAIDPLGRFVVYFKVNEVCNRDVLWFQPINSNGEATATPVQLLNCSARSLRELQIPSGLDILKD